MTPAPRATTAHPSRPGFLASMDDEPDAVRALAIAFRNLDVEQRRIRNRFARSLGLSATEFTAVMTISEGGPITPKTLAFELHLTPGAVTAMIDRLETAGLVERGPHPTDRRSLMLSLSEAGDTARHWVYTQYVEAVAAAAAMHPALVDSTFAASIELAAAALEDSAPGDGSPE